MTNLLFDINWSNLFTLSVSPIELFIRGTCVYLVLFFLLRFLPNRQIGVVGVTDLLVVILFANAAQNAMSSDYSSILDGLLLVLTIIFWSWLLNWLGYQFPPIQRLLTPPPLTLVENGEMLRRNMRRELITESELMLQFRKQGVENLEEVRSAFMEADGSISVITQERDVRPPTRPRVG